MNEDRLDEIKFFLVENKLCSYASKGKIRIWLEIPDFPVSYSCYAEKFANTIIKTLIAMSNWIKENTEQKLFDLRRTILIDKGMEAFFFVQTRRDPEFNRHKFNRVNFYENDRTGSCNFKNEGEFGHVNCIMPLDQINKLFDSWDKIKNEITKENKISTSGISLSGISLFGISLFDSAEKILNITK